MIGREVKVCGKIEGQGYIVESMCGHGVLSTKYRIKIMRVPIIPNETGCEVMMMVVSEVNGSRKKKKENFLADKNLLIFLTCILPATDLP